jgi:Histidine kinase
MAHRSLSDRILSFWPLQTGGWLLYALALVTTNAPLRHHRDLVAFRSSFLLCAFFESFVMYAICHALWRRRVWFLYSLLICTSASAVLALLSAPIPLWAESRASAGSDVVPWQNVLSNAPGAAFVLIAWSALYFGIQHYKLSEVERQRATEAERSARDAQLKALRYQLQPHFLFNTLNAISSLVVTENSKGATEMIARLADLLRSSLEAPDTHFVPFSEEVRVAHEYLAIERLRFRDRLHVSFEIDPDTVEILVPRFLLQPLLENAIRHGVSHLSAPGAILLKSSMDDSHLQILIRNDSNRLFAATPRTGSGVGLQNTRTRINQIYGSEGSVATSLRNDGTFDVTIEVSLSIPTYPSLTA